VNKFFCPVFSGQQLFSFFLIEQFAPALTPAHPEAQTKQAWDIRLMRTKI
jgi:hypothetical protein